MLAFLCVLGHSAITLRSGEVITASCSVKPGRYEIASKEDAKTGVVRIMGTGITVDFHGSTLAGSPDTVLSSARAGIGLSITGANIVLKNAHIRGFKVGLLARRAPHLKLIDCDFSYNWKQRLLSTLEREDESDWQSYHHNENDEWLRYGAGAYLADCDKFEVRGCRATGGQCGLMLVRSNKGKVWNNDFSFLSGVGLGLYRSSDNVVMHNKIDWCVRGFSYGVYNRGQDSAGILVYEQSNGNTFAYNSATHGGDGFFLWAGQTTMDSGKGGCNDNILYANDFSHAPANGIEATFSRNTFVHNLLVEDDYGIWGGYSYDSIAMDNGVAACRIGMAFEHSQRCDFSLNNFIHCKEGIQLWGTGKPDPNWGYGQHHEVRSIDNRLSFNHFVDVPGAAVWLRDSLNVTLGENHSYGPTKGIDAEATTFSSNTALVRADGPTPVAWIDQKEYPGSLAELIDAWDWSHSGAFNAFRVKPLSGGMNAFLPSTALRGRKYILVDEWGPYDFRYPRLWPRGADAKGDLLFEVLGPKGRWRVTGIENGEAVGPTSGSTSTDVDNPALISIKPSGGVGRTLEIHATFDGDAATDYRGVVTRARKTIEFGYTKFTARLGWDVKFFKWDKTTDPRTEPDAFKALIDGAPIATAKVDDLSYAGGAGWAPGVPGDYFAATADSDFAIEPGLYSLDLVTDDGCRVFVDGKPLQLVGDDGKPTSAFKYQGPTHYTAALDFGAGGNHHLRVEYFQIDGYKTLQVRLEPRQ